MSYYLCASVYPGSPTSYTTDLRDKFTGQQRDEDRLDYFIARYYADGQGRFTSADPLSGWPEDPQSWNRYAYARNSPLLYTDPAGLVFRLCTLEGTCDNNYADADFYTNFVMDNSVYLVGGYGVDDGGLILINGRAEGTFWHVSCDNDGPVCPQPQQRPSTTRGGRGGSRGGAERGGPETRRRGRRREEVVRTLNQCEKDALSPYIDSADLNAARLHPGLVPFYFIPFTQMGFIGITRGNDIYFTAGTYDPSTSGGLGLLGHELTHVGQYRNGMNWFTYLLSARRGYRSSRFEQAAFVNQNQITNDLSRSSFGGCP